VASNATPRTESTSLVLSDFILQSPITVTLGRLRTPDFALHKSRMVIGFSR
jgi:hypothetical protein